MTQNKKLIALTGGIGSGKSTVAKILKDFGYTVFSCDEIYANLLKKGVFNEVFLKNFGNVFYTDGTLNRKELANIVFANRDKLDLLNELTHKAIMTEVFNHAKSANKTCFIEVPLLFESNWQSQFDEVVVVIRNLQTRIQSIVDRDNISENEAKDRIYNQFNYDNADLSKYHVIINDGAINVLKSNINNFLVKIL